MKYFHLKQEPTFKIYVRPIDEEKGFSSFDIPPEDRFAIENFKLPIEVDIDEKNSVMESSHRAVVECLTNIIKEIDFDKYQNRFGG